MISKIIQKEKEQQTALKNIMIEHGMCETKSIDLDNFHKQSLINLKEYMEELLEMVGFTVIKKSGCEELSRHKFEEDIKELEEMIGRYS